MSIDRIGKSGGAAGTGPAAPTNEAGRAARPEEASRPFDVHAESAAAPRPADAVAPVGPTPLERLRAGQIDLPTYLDLKVDDATAHLRGVRPTELDAIRKMLRDQLTTDPALTELVKHATGLVPPAPKDE